VRSQAWDTGFPIALFESAINSGMFEVTTCAIELLKAILLSKFVVLCMSRRELKADQGAIQYPVLL